MYRLMFFIFVLTILLSSCGKSKPDQVDCSSFDNPEPFVNRTLSEQEVASSHRIYHNGYTSYGTITVDYPPPMEKPIVDWIYEMEDFTYRNVFVDNDGFVWFYSREPKVYGTSSDNYALKQEGKIKLTRLNPDGTLIWTKNICSNVEWESPLFELVGSCNGGVISAIISSYWSPREWGYDNVNYEYIDPSGNIIWRSQTIHEKGFNADNYVTMRISNNRLLVVAGDYRHSVFNILSLQNGEMQETIQFPRPVEFKYGINKTIPVEAVDGNWYVWNNKYIQKQDSSFNSIWQYAVDANEEILNMIAANKTILIHTTNDCGTLIALNPETGDEMWTLKDLRPTKLCGVTHNGNFLVKNFPSGFIFGDRKIAMISAEGEILWNIKCNISENETDLYKIDTVEYNDNNILFQGSDSFYLVSENGEIVWSMNLRDIGFKLKTKIFNGNFYPTPDGRIICFVEPRLRSQPLGSGLKHGYIVAFR